MIFVTCIDMNGNWSLQGKRLSKDAVAYKYIAEIAKGKTVFTTPKAAAGIEIFNDGKIEIITDEHPENRAGENDICFVEEKRLVNLNDINEVYLIKWLTCYPVCDKFDIPLTDKFNLKSECYFQGKSHNMIVVEHYV